MRVRILFKKTEAMRFTGHLDLQHAWMRVFRRAGLQLEHSQGFHPQPKLQLASALPLGYISSGEVLDGWLKDSATTMELAKSIQVALPPGLELITVEEIPPETLKVQVALKTADYQVVLPISEVSDGLADKINQFLEASEILVDRRGKVRNIRELVDSLEYCSSDNGRSVITMRLTARESATGRADEVLTHLGIDPLKCLIERTRLNFS
jgi:radical SAM-linked protein